jgi:hypothetical protein
MPPLAFGFIFGMALEPDWFKKRGVFVRPGEINTVASLFKKNQVSNPLSMNFISFSTLI